MTCRFLNADGIIDNRDINTKNLFQYCGNNPINNIDPSGYLPILLTSGPLLNPAFILKAITSPSKSVTSTPSKPPAQPAPSKPKTVSTKGQSLIKNYDSIVGSGGQPHLEAYNDIYGVKTIGWGYTAQRTPSLVPEKITFAQAEEFFQSDLTRFTSKANEIIVTWDLNLSQQQYDAAIMYAFQLGQNGTGSTSLTALMKAMGAGNNNTVRSILSGWGRRDDEWELYANGDYNRNH